ncbi:MAG: c-type cytochrome biogenesis protein CcsB [Alcaligenaceae bacterium]|nr:c-type cytochrome biogenesis protein CcsB [Alcaligenaceae bacterium]
MTNQKQADLWWEETSRAEVVGDASSVKGPLRLMDYVFFSVLVILLMFVMVNYRSSLDIYDDLILSGSLLTLGYFGWFWRPIRNLSLVCGLLVAVALYIYGQDIQQGDIAFLLKYALASQPAVLWMCVCFFLSTFFYWLSIPFKSIRWAGTAMAWGGALMGFVGLFVRWRETYLSGEGLGYIPISNLYEVVILFALLTTLFYLFYEQRYKASILGGFVMSVVSAACIFLLWYSLDRGAGQIGPLNNALNSWWMKLHVPANFVGYGTFALAAMVAVAYLIKAYFPNSSWVKSLPSLIVLDDMMYRAISIGFVFFTIATVLGAFWASEAWGTYWQWDPKETWALIVWLNYAAWLHLRLIKGVRGTISAYWAIIGFFVTLFAFLGVNMFLSGLHSYGAL